jgi:hypothetical protein
MLNILKGTASHEASYHHAFMNAPYWMRGYQIDTVSPRSLEPALAYVRNQHQRHPDKVAE